MLMIMMEMITNIDMSGRIKINIGPEKDNAKKFVTSDLKLEPKTLG